MAELKKAETGALVQLNQDEARVRRVPTLGVKGKRPVVGSWDQKGLRYVLAVVNLVRPAVHARTLARAFGEAATLHLLTLLEVAASFWQCWGLWDRHELKNQRPTAPDQDKADDADDPEREETEIVRILCIVRH